MIKINQRVNCLLSILLTNKYPKWYSRNNNNLVDWNSIYFFFNFQELHEQKWLQNLLFTSTVVLCLRISSAAPHLPTFSSHVSFNTPTTSFSHGVGDLKPAGHSRNLYRNIHLKAPQRYGTFRSLHCEFEQDSYYSFIYYKIIKYFYNILW